MNSAIDIEKIKLAEKIRYCARTHIEVQIKSTVHDIDDRNNHVLQKMLLERKVAAINFEQAESSIQKEYNLHVFEKYNEVIKFKKKHLL